MTLRRRLLLAVAVLLTALLVAGVLVLQLQRRSLLAQIDARLTTLVSSPRLLLQVTRTDPPGAPLPEGWADVYVGRLAANGKWTVVISPVGDPAQHPAVQPTEVLDPVTRRMQGTTSGARVATARLPNGALAVVAIPLDGFTQSMARLRTLLLVVGLVILGVLSVLVGWVQRLGVSPLTRMTAVADAITAGDQDARVAAADLQPHGTEAARLGSALNAMADANQASTLALQRFVADASHELRTPLTTLRGYAALHRSQPDVPAETAEALRRMESEAARMSRLVDSLLDLTTLDERGLASRTRVDLSALLADVVSDLTVLAPGHTVTSAIPQGLATVGDRDRLVQALMGLGSNAVRHTPPGTTIDLSASLTTDPGAPQGPLLVRIALSDNGPGIPEAHLTRVFERFHRVDGSRSSASGGTGLGLAVVAAITRAHDGTIRAEARPEGGVLFVLTLPADPPH